MLWCVYFGLSEALQCLVRSVLTESVVLTVGADRIKFGERAHANGCFAQIWKCAVYMRVLCSWGLMGVRVHRARLWLIIQLRLIIKAAQISLWFHLNCRQNVPLRRSESPLLQFAVNIQQKDHTLLRFGPAGPTAGPLPLVRPGSRKRTFGDDLGAFREYLLRGQACAPIMSHLHF